MKSNGYHRSPEDKLWFAVRGLKLGRPKGGATYLKAIEDSSPESGNFILLSMRRRKLDQEDGSTESES